MLRTAGPGVRLGRHGLTASCPWWWYVDNRYQMLYVLRQVPRVCASFPRLIPDVKPLVASIWAAPCQLPTHSLPTDRRSQLPPYHQTLNPPHLSIQCGGALLVRDIVYPASSSSSSSCPFILPTHTDPVGRRESRPNQACRRLNQSESRLAHLCPAPAMLESGIRGIMCTCICLINQLQLKSAAIVWSRHGHNNLLERESQDFVKSICFVANTNTNTASLRAQLWSKTTPWQLKLTRPFHHCHHQPRPLKLNTTSEP